MIRKMLVIGIAAIGVAILIALARDGSYFTWLLDWVRSFGKLAPAVFALSYVATCILLLPGGFLTPGAGVLFGILKGTALVSLSATVGSTCAFLISRYIAHHQARNALVHNSHFQLINRALKSGGWKILVLLRLCPIVPFRLSNYALGLTEISLQKFVLATWIGTLPSAIAYVYLGAVAGDIMHMNRKALSPVEWMLYALGLLATLTLALIIARYARSIVQRHVR